MPVYRTLIVLSSLRTALSPQHSSKSRFPSSTAFLRHSNPSSSRAFASKQLFVAYPATPDPRRRRKFATSARLTSMDTLLSKVEGLTLESIHDKYPDCRPEINPFDLYRAHLANVLNQITGVDTKIIYPQLAWTASLDKGDLVLAAPALRIKGKKPDQLAELVQEWTDKVRTSCRPGTPSLAIMLTLASHAVP